MYLKRDWTTDMNDSSCRTDGNWISTSDDEIHLWFYQITDGEDESISWLSERETFSGSSCSNVTISDGLKRVLSFGLKSSLWW